MIFFITWLILGCISLLILDREIRTNKKLKDDPELKLTLSHPYTTLLLLITVFIFGWLMVPLEVVSKVVEYVRK